MCGVVIHVGILYMYVLELVGDAIVSDVPMA